MTQEDKDLLFKDLCARLPYGVKATTTSNGWRDVYIVSGCNDDRIYLDCPVYDEGDDEWLIESVKPYLRPMSSMTEEEKKEYNKTCITKFIKAEPGFIKAGPGYTYDGWWEHYDTIASFDWLIAHHFDYHHLMEKGLALEAPEGMYNH